MRRRCWRCSIGWREEEEEEEDDSRHGIGFAIHSSAAHT